MTKIVNYHTQSVPSTIEGAQLMAVLTRDDVDQYAVYLGIVVQGVLERDGDWSHDNAVWVAGHGRKLSLRDASIYFGGLNEDNYRR